MHTRTKKLMFTVHSMYLGPKSLEVHKALFLAFSVETNRTMSEACNFLTIWHVELVDAAQE